MRKIGLAVAVTAALWAGAMAGGSAQATPASGLNLGTAATGLGMVEQAQFVIGGRNYCWYAGGWHGPGWYWCGYAWRRGFGWGGPRGWHNWVWHGWHRGGVVHGRVGVRGRVVVHRHGFAHRGSRPVVVHRRGGHAVHSGGHVGRSGGHAGRSGGHGGRSGGHGGRHK